MAARRYSERLGRLDDRQFQAALARLGLGDFLRADPISGGLFGQNVFVTSTTGSWVLRGVPHYDWQLPAERFFCELLHQRTSTPVPWPYLIDPRDDIFGWSYAIMPRLPGLQLSDRGVAATRTRQDRRGQAQAMAENLVRMQQLTWPVAGGFELTAQTIMPFPGGWADWVSADVQRWLALARMHSNRTTDSDSDWVAQVCESARAALAEPFQPCFVMHDYKEQNATFARRDAGWMVCGIFDLMEAFFGDGEIDLARQTVQYTDEDPTLAAAFVGRYHELKAERPCFGERQRLYVLWDRLVVWEYDQRPAQAGAWSGGQTLRAWLEPIVERCMAAAGAAGSH